MRGSDKWIIGGFVTLLILIVSSGALHSNNREKSAAEAKEHEAKLAAAEKVAKAAKVAEEKKKFDELPAASKARIDFGKVIQVLINQMVGAFLFTRPERITTP